MKNRLNDVKKSQANAGDRVFPSKKPSIPSDEVLKDKLTRILKKSQEIDALEDELYGEDSSGPDGTAFQAQLMEGYRGFLEHSAKLQAAREKRQAKQPPKPDPSDDDQQLLF